MTDPTPSAEPTGPSVTAEPAAPAGRTFVSTHVLDTGTGRPAVGVGVALEDADGSVLGSGRTDEDGRLAAVGPPRLQPGRYTLRFDSGAYFAGVGTTTFYPEVMVAFTVTDAESHLHVPLLLSPFGYSTYRGS
ncbi:MAG: uraH [Humibacillus sp.]|nr:uraH [Humibacillus sp.]